MRATLLVALLAGCVSTNEVVCSDGLVCPEQATCVTIASAMYCALPGQLAQCDGAAEGTACDWQGVPSACHVGVCVPVECGNTLADPGESCDDGNTQSGDGCSADCQSTEVCGNGHIDLVGGEQCDDGNRNAFDGCAPSCIDESPTWTLMLGQRPAFVGDAAIAFDSRRNRVVLFGGSEGVVAGDIIHDETNEWDGVRWFQPAVTVHPQGRTLHAMAYDARHGVTVLFSGSTLTADTWLWDGVRWRIATGQVAPPARTYASMVYDTKRERILLFGGGLQDTWQWTGPADGEGSWSQLAVASSPPARAGAQMAYDPKRDRVVLYGGSGALVDLWEFDGTTWTQIAFTGGPGVRNSGLMTFDPVSQHVILVGGTPAIPADVWDWDGTTWTKRATDFPFELAFGSITTDTARGRVVVWDSDGVFELVGSSWITPPDGASYRDFDEPVGRAFAIGVYDPLRGHVVVHGGVLDGGAATRSNDTLLWDGSWTLAGLGPSARDGAGAAFDRARGEVVMFGGFNGSVYLNDTHSYATGWTTEQPTTIPPARTDASVAYDDVHHEIVMFGGYNGAPLGDTWVWDGVNWTQVSPASGPSARRGAAIGYDEERKQIVMFGGANDNPSSAFFDDTWVWDGAARRWTQVSSAVVTPIGRWLGKLAWDAGRRRLVLAGGRFAMTTSSIAPDAWEWTGTGWSLVPVNTGPAFFGHTLVPGADGGVVMLTGQAGASVSLEVWRLRYEGEARYETCTNIDVDGDGLAGCMDSDCAAVCEPCGNGVCESNVETCASCPADCTCP